VIWKTGDKLVLTHGERTVAATVKLASPCGRSLMLAFEALLGGYAGMMPVLRHTDGEYRDLITTSVVTLAPFGSPAVHILRGGSALCGIPGVPCEWPEGHRWTDEAKADVATCSGCRGKVEEAGRALVR
jgi:hypothetical protein